MKKIIYSCLLIASLPVANAATQKNKLDRLKWLLNSWEMQKPQGKLYEQWKGASNIQWNGTSYFIRANGDTASYEKIRLVLTGGTLIYMPTVRNQNGGREISFTEKSISDTSVVFENMEHDFPKRIGYTRTSDSTMHAYIWGTANGKEKQIDFYYTKANKN